MSNPDKTMKYRHKLWYVFAIIVAIILFLGYMSGTE